MSEENVEIVRRAYGAFNSRDKATFDEVTSPEIEVHPVPEWPENSVILGREAVWEFFVGNEAVWEGGDYELSEEIEVRDVVVTCAERRVAGKGSGVPVGDLRFHCVFTVDHGKVVRGDFFLEREQALEAAGLSE